MLLSKNLLSSSNELKHKIIRIKTIDGEEAFVIKAGHPILCKYCNKFGHVKANCQTYGERSSLTCSICHKKGHSTQEHTANMIRDGKFDKIENDLDCEGADVLDQGINENFQTGLFSNAEIEKSFAELETIIFDNKSNKRSLDPLDNSLNEDTNPKNGRLSIGPFLLMHNTMLIYKLIVTLAS